MPQHLHKQSGGSNTAEEEPRLKSTVLTQLRKSLSKSLHAPLPEPRKGSKALSEGAYLSSCLGIFLSACQGSEDYGMWNAVAYLTELIVSQNATPALSL